MLEIRDFPGRQEDERIELFVRSHELYLLWRLLPPLLFAFIAFAVSVALTNTFHEDLLLLTLIILLISIPPLLWLFWRFSLWYYDYFIITNRRVVDFTRKPFIYETRNETQLSRVQDVLVVFPNPVCLLFNFGNVLVQTAGMAGQLTFRYAARPHQVQARLLDLVGQTRGPRRESGPLDQLVGALRQSLEPSPPAVSTAPSQSTPASSDGGVPPSRRQPRTFRDMFFYHPVEGANPQTWRKHWWVLLKAISPSIIPLGLALGFFVLLPIPISRLVAAAVFVIGVFYLAWQTADWYNDAYIITDDRIVDIEKVPLTSEQRREAQLTLIQDVSYVQPNFTARLLGFGNVLVQTAARTGAFTFENVPNPRQVQREIFTRWERARQPQRTPASAETAREFIELWDRYHEAKHK